MSEDAEDQGYRRSLIDTNSMTDMIDMSHVAIVDVAVVARSRHRSDALKTYRSIQRFIDKPWRGKAG